MSLRFSPRWAVALCFLAVAVALRIADFGNPIIHVDEQYYLLVGERLLDGAVPYIDVWDRKPVGLFLLYAGAAALPGDDILGYQLLATLFAALTALVVASGAKTVGASRTGAIAAGIAYLVWLPLLGGRGGQAPVFYNLLIATAARIVIGFPWLAERSARAAILRRGATACLLAGLAVQVKTTAAFEAAFVGLAGLWWLHRAGARVVTLAGSAILWMAIGIAPTLAAAGWYWRVGAFDAWWFANVTSILERPGYPAGEIAMRLLGILAQLSPLLLCAAIAWRRRRVRLVGERATAFAWLAAAAVGFAAIGTFFDHYALPLLPPLAMAGGIALGRIPRVLVGTLALGLLLLLVERSFIRDDAPGARAVAEVVRRNSGGGCPWVFIGDTATYSLAGACLPTSRAFPNFLAYTTEAGATGIDEAAEARRILAARPPVIVSSTRKLKIWNRAVLAELRPALARDYRPVFSTPRADYRTIVYLRRDLPFRR
ncbi:hypothetical protein M9980_01525 [Sphingomonas donggukensis]|uniref:Glycosyltransferase RgtA/B/C/D-like domain-containing protein n=1 Tax=Sphingomonas donggukensis TaxID=2949093 RepID=A0ABY4TU56_9SPHN|nr:hypothetical protein [Sphingomonas donggukensis]URW75938.1 hypothetical protein M9980_01525 [Sphingomonas donggukensis]